MSGAARWGGLIVAVALAVAAVTVSPTSAQTTAPPPNTQICKKSNGYYQDRADPRYFYQCDGAYRPYRHMCPDGLYFNEDPQVLVCDWPDNVRVHTEINTVTLRASTATLKDVPFKITGMSATMSPGLIGEKVTFKTTSGKVLCIRGTESIGGQEQQGDSIAMCDVKPEARGLTESLLKGYVVTYDGPAAKPASAKGQVRLVKTGGALRRMGGELLR